MAKVLTNCKPDTTRPPVWCTRCGFRGHPLMPGLGPYCASCEHWDVHLYDVEAEKLREARVSAARARLEAMKRRLHELDEFHYGGLTWQIEAAGLRLDIDAYACFLAHHCPEQKA